MKTRVLLSIFLLTIIGLVGCKNDDILSHDQNFTSQSFINHNKDNIEAPHDAGSLHNFCIETYENIVGLDKIDTLIFDSIVNCVLSNDTFNIDYNNCYILDKTIKGYAEERRITGNISDSFYDFLLFLDEEISDCDNVEYLFLEVEDYIKDLNIDSLSEIDYYTIISTGIIFIDSYNFWDSRLQKNRLPFNSIVAGMAIVDAISYGDCMQELTSNPDFNPRLIMQAHNACIESSAFSSLAYFVSRL
ncbi:MAG: hypothetical protein U9N51_08470 [Bacteroidota bacterium]|nr:hypothetical protein [Bacteroidota bacterium]